MATHTYPPNTRQIRGDPPSQGRFDLESAGLLEGLPGNLPTRIEKTAPAPPEPNGWNTTQELTDLIADKLSAEVEAATGIWQLLNYAKSGDQRTLQVLISPTGQCARTYTANPDGTITVSAQDTHDHRPAAPHRR